MSKKNKAIFAGTSNTMGLGLELELSERFQKDEYLMNCKNIPPVDEQGTGYDEYTDEDKENQRKYRWPRIISNYFNLEEININDPIVEHPIESLYEIRQAVDIVFNLYDRRESEDVKKLLSETKYIFLEFGYIRWWEDELHGVNTEFRWPTTPSEIDKFLKSKDIDFEKKQKAIDWLNNVNPIELWERTLNKVNLMKESFPHIKFILLAWGINSDVFNLELTKKFSDNFIKMPNVDENDFHSADIGNFLSQNRLVIKDTVKAYNKKYKSKWLYEDYHASKKGHEIIANQIIKKLQNETRGMHTI